MPGHLIERDGRLFGPKPSAWREADRADRAAIHRPFDSDSEGCLKNHPGAGDIDVVKDRRFWGPKRIVRSNMVELPAAGQGGAEGGRIAQVACHSFDGQTFEILEIRVGTSEHANVDAGT